MTEYIKESKEIADSCSDAIKQAVKAVADTMGPRGRTVLIRQEDGKTIVTKDGVTVAKNLRFETPFQEALFSIIRQASLQTNQNAGDGTTTAMVLAGAIYENAQKHLSAGVPAVELQRGIFRGLERVLERIRSEALNIESLADIENIARISANGDEEITENVTKAMSACGKDGIVVLSNSHHPGTTLTTVEGYRHSAGWYSSEFVTNEAAQVCTLKEPYILVTDEKITEPSQILPLMNLMKRDNSSLIIVAEEVSDMAMGILVANFVRKSSTCVPVRAFSYGEEKHEILKDLAIATGATFLSKYSGKSVVDVVMADLGKCEEAQIHRGSTIFSRAAGDISEINTRIEAIKTQIMEAKEEQEMIRLQARISKLSSIVVQINIGGYTEAEVQEKRYRYEDAIEAVRSASEAGMLPGGGAFLARESYELLKWASENITNEMQMAGVKTLAESMRAPLSAISLNSGHYPEIAIFHLKQSDNLEDVIDFREETIRLTNCRESGILDPAKVTENALRNAASAASTLFMTNFVIIGH